MPRLFAPHGRTGTIHSRNNPNKVYNIDEKGTVVVDRQDDISDLVAAGFSYSPVPKAAAAMEEADQAEAEAKAAEEEAQKKAEHAKGRREHADRMRANAEEATGGNPLVAPSEMRPESATDRTVFSGGSASPAGAVGPEANRQPPPGAVIQEPKPGAVYETGTGKFTVDRVNTDGSVVGKWDDGKKMTYQRSDLDAMQSGVVREAATA